VSESACGGQAERQAGGIPPGGMVGRRTCWEKERIEGRKGRQTETQGGE